MLARCARPAGRRSARPRCKPPIEYVIASIPEYLRFPLRQLAPLKLKKMKPTRRIAKRFATGAAPASPSRSAWIGPTSPATPPTVEVSMDDTVAVIQYTGGTTGPSRRARC